MNIIRGALIWHKRRWSTKTVPPLPIAAVNTSSDYVFLLRMNTHYVINLLNPHRGKVCAWICDTWDFKSPHAWREI